METVMNKIFKLAALLSACLMTFACAPEELSTDQYPDDAVNFAAFAPNPVARGGALRIVGSNLQRIVEVQIPGINPITDIEVVKEGHESEIRVIIPVDGPEVGKVAIVDLCGNTHVSLADITYSEPIIFDDFTPKNAMPGEVITIKGDYMNNIRAVQFAGGAVVTEFPEQSRYQMKVVVPANAITGKIIIADVDENNNPDGLIPNLFYSQDELVIGEPDVVAADRGTLKLGDEVTVTGEHLEMIKSVNFGGVDVDFTVAEDGKSLTAVLPATAVDGDLVLVSFAGTEHKAGAYTTLVPSELKIAPETRYKAGLNAVVTGKDLDLVTGAALAGTALEYVYADGAITFPIPATAVDGAVTLTLANGKTVDTEAIELVKPVITAVAPLELYAGDEPVIVSGEDLDLVVSATLGGRDEEIEVAADGKSVKVATTVSSVSGKIVLTLENGVTVESADEVKVNYHSLVIVTEMPAMQHIGEEVVLKGSNFSLVENIFIGDAKVTQYSVRTDNEVRFLMPWNKVGMYNITFNLFSGDVETVATPIEVGLERVFNTIWEGESYVTWSGGAVTNLSWGGYDWSTVKPGTTIVANFEVVDDNAAVRFGNGSWSALPTSKTLPGADGDGNIAVAKGTTYLSFVLSAADLAELQNNGGLVLCGTGYNITSIVLITEISQEITIYEGPTALTWGDDGRFGLAMNYFEGLNAGAKMIIYFTQTDAWGQVQFNDGWWGNGDVSFPELGGAYLNTDNAGGKDVTRMELTLTQELLDHLLATAGDYWGTNADYHNGDTRVAFVIQGQDWIIDKITILP